MIFKHIHKTITSMTRLINKLVALALITLIWLIRPMLGPMNICPFSVGCTQYALLQLHEQPLLTAIKQILQRLIQCHPLGKRKP